MCTGEINWSGGAIFTECRYPRVLLVYLSGRKAKKKNHAHNIFASCILCIVCLRASLFVFGELVEAGGTEEGEGEETMKESSCLCCCAALITPLRRWINIQQSALVGLQVNTNLRYLIPLSVSPPLYASGK